MLNRIANWLLGAETVKNRELLLGSGRLFDEPRRRSGAIYAPAKLNNQHLVCVGSSGCGKTRFLYSLLEQKIEDSNASIILMDPHGDLHKKVLSLIAHKVFAEGEGDLAERLVLIEPTNLQYGSIGLNILETEPGQLPYEIVAELISAYHAIWFEAWGARMEDILRNSCLALQEKGLTLVEMPWLLMDEDFRKFIVSKISDDDVKLYFEKHFHGFKDTDQKFFIESTRNKVSAFTSNPYLKPILGQKQSTVRFADIMNEGKICLINLSRNHLKTESRRLFGSLLFAKILMAVISRENIPEEKRVPVSVFCDEAHEIFCQDLFLPILEGGRKFKCQFGGLFFQTLSQFEPEDVDIILGNTSIQVCFQVGRKDAERMAREFFSFSGKMVKDQERDIFGPKGKPTYYSVQEEIENAISELTNQKTMECYIKLKGVSSAPYIAQTLPVEYLKPNYEWEETLREISASKYNRSKEEIEREIKERRDSLEKAVKEIEEW